MASFGRLISTVDPPSPIQHMAKPILIPRSYVTGLCLVAKDSRDRCSGIETLSHYRI